VAESAPSEIRKVKTACQNYMSLGGQGRIYAPRKISSKLKTRFFGKKEYSYRRWSEIKVEIKICEFFYQKKAEKRR